MEKSVLDTLNPKQKEAASICTSHLRIVAGAGSGKTRVVTTRIAWLVQEVGTPPWKIMAITFTNKAAREMKERLETMLGLDAKDVKVSTIHSLALRMLRTDGEKAGWPRNFAVLDSQDQKTIIRNINKEQGNDANEAAPAKVLAMISNWKTAGIQPEQAEKSACSETGKTAARIYQAYQQTLTSMQAMDFDDLLIQADRLLDNDEVRTKWQNRIDYLHVDEFQDVDPLQYSIIKKLTGPETLLCVVGDPDQTIYTWRGADVNIILTFKNDFPGTKTVILDQNYRSTKPILSAANAVIAHNTHRIKKDLYTENTGSKNIALYSPATEAEEAMETGRRLLEAHKAGRPWHEMAVLYRSNYQSRALERMFSKQRIPHIIYGGIRFYERKEVKDMLSYLQLITDNPGKSSDLALERIINTPKRGIGAVTLNKLKKQADEKGIPMLDILANPENISKAAAAKVQKLHDDLAQWKEDKGNTDLPGLVMQIAEETGYLDMIQDKDEEERLENIQELGNDLRQFLKEHPGGTLEDYLQDISLYTDRAEEKLEDTVSLMTVHSAKGLEFEQVHITGMNEQVFPSSRSVEEGGKAALEEERRLFYVAMTRAKQELAISWNTDYSPVLQSVRTRSRFIGEIPAEWTDAPKKEPARKTQAIPKRGTRPVMTKRNLKLRPGDTVEHQAWGEGVVLAVDKDIVDVAFSYGIGRRKLNRNHPSLRKKEKA